MTSLVLNSVRWADPLSSIAFIGWRCGTQIKWLAGSWWGWVQHFQVSFSAGGDDLGLSRQVWDSVCWSAVWGWQVVVHLEKEGRIVVGTDQAHEMHGNSEPLKEKLGLSASPGGSRESSPLSSACRSYLVVLVELGKCNFKEAQLPTLPASLIPDLGGP